MVDSSTDYEVIIINDGSSDKTLSLINGFIQSHLQHNIRVYSQENLGSAQARNSAIRIAQGQYLFFCDSDDQIELENILSNIRSDSEFDICIGNWSNSKTIGEAPYSFSKSILDYEFSTNLSLEDRQILIGRKGFWASIYSRDYIFGQNILFVPTFLQAGGYFVFDDLFFLFQVYSGDPRIEYSNQIFYRYTRPKDGHDLKYLRQLVLQPSALRFFRKHIRHFPLNAREIATNFAINRMIASYKLVRDRIGFFDKVDWGLVIIEFSCNLPCDKRVFLFLRVFKMWVIKS